MRTDRGWLGEALCLLWGIASPMWSRPKECCPDLLCFAPGKCQFNFNKMYMMETFEAASISYVIKQEIFSIYNISITLFKQNKILLFFVIIIRSILPHEDNPSRWSEHMPQTYWGPPHWQLEWWRRRGCILVPRTSQTCPGPHKSGSPCPWRRSCCVYQTLEPEIHY